MLLVDKHSLTQKQRCPQDKNTRRQTNVITTLYRYLYYSYFGICIDRIVLSWMDHKEQPSDSRYGELAENNGFFAETLYNIFKSSSESPLQGSKHQEEEPDSMISFPMEKAGVLALQNLLSEIMSFGDSSSKERKKPGNTHQEEEEERDTICRQMETVGVLALQKFLREVMDFDYSDTSRWKKGIKMERAGVRALKKLLGEIMTFGVSSLKKRKKRGNERLENVKGSKRAKLCETVVSRKRTRVATDFFRSSQEERRKEKQTQRDRLPKPTPISKVRRKPKDVSLKKRTNRGKSRPENETVGSRKRIRVATDFFRSSQEERREEKPTQRGGLPKPTPVSKVRRTPKDVSLKKRTNRCKSRLENETVVSRRRIRVATDFFRPSQEERREENPTQRDGPPEPTAVVEVRRTPKDVSLKKRKKDGNGHQENEKGSQRAKLCETVVSRKRIRVVTDFFRPSQERREENPTQRDGPPESTPVVEVRRTPKDVSLKKRTKRGNGHQENEKGSQRAKLFETVVSRKRIRVATDFFRPSQEERWEEKPTQRDGPPESTPVVEVRRTPKDVSLKKRTKRGKSRLENETVVSRRRIRVATDFFRPSQEERWEEKPTQRDGPPEPTPVLEVHRTPKDVNRHQENDKGSKRAKPCETVVSRRGRIRVTTDFFRPPQFVVHCKDVSSVQR